MQVTWTLSRIYAILFAISFFLSVFVSLVVWDDVGESGGHGSRAFFLSHSAFPSDVLPNSLHRELKHKEQQQQQQQQQQQKQSGEEFEEYFQESEEIFGRPDSLSDVLREKLFSGTNFSQIDKTGYRSKSGLEASDRAVPAGPSSDPLPEFLLLASLNRSSDVFFSVVSLSEEVVESTHQTTTEAEGAGVVSPDGTASVQSEKTGKLPLKRVSQERFVAHAVDKHIGGRYSARESPLATSSLRRYRRSTTGFFHVASPGSLPRTTLLGGDWSLLSSVSLEGPIDLIAHTHDAVWSAAVFSSPDNGDSGLSSFHLALVKYSNVVDGASGLDKSVDVRTVRLPLQSEPTAMAISPRRSKEDDGGSVVDVYIAFRRDRHVMRHYIASFGEEGSSSLSLSLASVGPTALKRFGSSHVCSLEPLSPNEVVSGSPTPRVLITEYHSSINGGYESGFKSFVVAFGPSGLAPDIHKKKPAVTWEMTFLDKKETIEEDVRVIDFDLSPDGDVIPTGTNGEEDVSAGQEEGKSGQPFWQVVDVLATRLGVEERGPDRSATWAVSSSPNGKHTALTSTPFILVADGLNRPIEIINLQSGVHFTHVALSDDGDFIAITDNRNDVVILERIRFTEAERQLMMEGGEASHLAWQVALDVKLPTSFRNKHILSVGLFGTDPSRQSLGESHDKQGDGERHIFLTLLLESGITATIDIQSTVYGRQPGLSGDILNILEDMDDSTFYTFLFGLPLLLSLTGVW